MAVLANIVVTVATLKEFRPDILKRFQYSTESGEVKPFDDEIERAKRTLYREVLKQERKNSPGLDEAELKTRLEKVKEDEDASYLTDRLSLRSLEYIFQANDLIDEAMLFRSQANGVDLIYFVDLDEDDVIDEDEKRRIQPTGFTR